MGNMLSSLQKNTCPILIVPLCVRISSILNHKRKNNKNAFYEKRFQLCQYLLIDCFFI